MLILKNINCKQYLSSRQFIESLLIELISKTDILKQASEYVDDFDNTKPLNYYQKDDNVMEVKEDLSQMFRELVSTIEEIPKVRRVKYHRSDYFGLSNYMDIFFDKPNNSKYLSKHKNLYNMEIKISDHFHAGHGDEDIESTGKTFLEISDDIITIIKNRIKLINTTEKKYNNMLNYKTSKTINTHQINSNN